jgi:hypothetical protein
MNEMEGCIVTFKPFGVIPTDNPRSVTMPLDPVKDDTNPKDLIGSKKPRLSLVSPAGMIYEALAMGNGAEKYGPYNWRDKSVQVMIYLEAAMRHLLEFQDGADLDQDLENCEGCKERLANPKVACKNGHSWLPHLAHAKACVGIIIDALETGHLIDNRPKPGAAARLIDKFTKKDK